MLAPQALCQIISSFEPWKRFRKHSPYLDSNQLFISFKDAKCERSFCEHQCFFWYVPFHECKFFSRNCIDYCFDRQDKLTRGEDEWGKLSSIIEISDILPLTTMPSYSKTTSWAFNEYQYHLTNEGRCLLLDYQTTWHFQRLLLPPKNKCYATYGLTPSFQPGVKTSAQG